MWAVENYSDLGSRARGILPSLGNLTNEAERTLDLPRQRSCHGKMVVNGVVVGPFEEEEEGTGVTSDVVKVEGEDPATPGPLP